MNRFLPSSNKQRSLSSPKMHELPYGSAQFSFEDVTHGLRQNPSAACFFIGLQGNKLQTRSWATAFNSIPPSSMDLTALCSKTALCSFLSSRSSHYLYIHRYTYRERWLVQQSLKKYTTKDVSTSWTENFLLCSQRNPWFLSDRR